MRAPMMSAKRRLVAVRVLGPALAVLACSCSARDPGSPTSGAADPITIIRGALGTPMALREVKPNITWGGRGVSISVDPTNAAVAIGASDAGGLFKTTDGGTHFAHLDGLLPFRMSEVRISPSQPNVVLATAFIDSHTVNQAGIWRSTDGGVTWTRPATADPPGCPRAGAWGISFAPDSNFVYAGTDCSLAVSSDLGATWTHVTPTGSAVGVRAVLAQANKVVNVQLNGFADGFRRSLDNGSTWTTTGGGLPSNGDVHGLAASPINPELLIASGVDVNGSPQAFESDDAGVSWHSLNGPFLTCPNGSVCPNGRPAYVSTHASRDGDPTHFELYWGNTANDYRQTCRGTSGMRCNSDWEFLQHAHEDSMEVAWGPGSNCPLYIIGDGGVQGTTDFGTATCGLNWTMVGTGPGGWGALQIFDVEATVHPGHTDVYFGTQDNELWASPDDAVTWPGINRPNGGVLGREGFNIEAPHSSLTDDQTVAGRANLVGGATGLFKQNAHWTLPENTAWPNPPQGFPSSAPIFVAPLTWVQFVQGTPATSNDLYLSTDDGGSWTRVGNVTITDSIGPGPPDQPSFWRSRIAGPAGAPKLFVPVTRSDGTNGLKRVTGILGGSPLLENADADLVDLATYHVGTLQPVWNVDPRDANRLYAYDAGAGQAKFSTDGGDHWKIDPMLTSLLSGNGQFLSAAHHSNVFFDMNQQMSSVRFDDQDGRRILVGTEASGILASFNGGTSWMHLPDTQIPAVSSFFFDEARADVYVSTYARGLWKLGWCAAGGTDTTAPTFTFVPPDIATQNCGAVVLGNARAVDVCGTGNVTITNNAPARFAPGTTTVTWTARDAAGNTATATQRVTLVLGDDPACCPAGTNIILGTSNNDTLNGTAGNDCILGRGGQDVINGLGGNDFISGGDGDDRIDGGSGNDVIFGGSGQDNLTGGAGDDSLFGGDGDDQLHGGTGNDTLHGGQGQDQLFGEDNDDTLFGDDGSDRLDGGAGNDNLIGGGQQNDVCIGGTGTNTFVSCPAPSPNSCVDGVRNGLETATDCGGACAVKCAVGQACVSANDCANGLCAAGACRPSDGPAGDFTGLVQASRQITTDWGGGYCAALQVINNAAVPTTNWSVVVNLNQTTTYTTWNGNFTGNSGTVTVTPAAAFNQAIPPGATDGSVGFCANRNVPNSGTLPSIVSASGSY